MRVLCEQAGRWHSEPQAEEMTEPPRRKRPRELAELVQVVAKGATLREAARCPPRSGSILAVLVVVIVAERPFDILVTNRDSASALENPLTNRSTPGQPCSLVNTLLLDLLGRRRRKCLELLYGEDPVALHHHVTTLPPGNQKIGLTMMACSREGPTEMRSTGHSSNSSTRRMNACACGGRSSKLRTSVVGVCQPGSSS